MSAVETPPARLLRAVAATADGWLAERARSNAAAALEAGRDRRRQQRFEETELLLVGPAPAVSSVSA